MPWLLALPFADAAPPTTPALPALIDVAFDNADVHAAMRFLAEVGDVNIVIGDEVAGTVTLQLHHVTWDEAFQTVLAQKGLLAVPVGSTWEVHAR